MTDNNAGRESDNQLDEPETAEPYRPDEASQDAERSPAAPERPEMSDTTPAPIPPKASPTGSVKTTRSLWIMSFLAGLAAAMFIFFGRDGRMEPLRTTIDELAPDRDAETLDAVVALVFWGSLGGFVLVIVIEMLLVWAMMRRHNSARWLLLFVLLVNAGVALLADSFLAAPGGDVLYIRLLLLAQLLIAFLATIVMMLPGTGSWVRAERQPGSGTGV